MPISHAVPQLALLLGAAVVVVWSLFVRHDRQWWAAPIALAACAVSIATQAQLLTEPAQATFDGMWALDGVTGWTSITITAATALTITLSPDWMRTDRRHGEYHAMLLFAAIGAFLLAAATDVLQLIVALVLSSVTGYVLASYHRRSPLSAEAGIKFFLIGGLTNSLLLIGAVFLYAVGGTTLYGELSTSLVGTDPVVLLLLTGLLVIGIAFELGAVPAHAWVPDIAEGAPAPAAAFLTVVPKLGALVAMARFVQILPPDAVGWRPLLAVVATLTMTIGNLAALWQTDVRRLLGWSSVSQAGYGLLAVVALGRTDTAMPALLTFLIAYASANLAAFGVVTHLRGRTRLGDYAGLGRARPWLAAGFTLALLSLVGIPPLIGFGAKLQLFTAAIDAGYGWLAVVAVANTVVSLAYYLRIIGPMYLQPAAVPQPVLGRWSATATTVAAVGVVVTGILAEPLVEAFSRAALVR